MAIPSLYPFTFTCCVRIARTFLISQFESAFIEKTDKTLKRSVFTLQDWSKLVLVIELFEYWIIVRVDLTWYSQLAEFWPQSSMWINQYAFLPAVLVCRRCGEKAVKKGFHVSIL